MRLGSRGSVMKIGKARVGKQGAGFQLWSQWNVNVCIE